MLKARALLRNHPPQEALAALDASASSKLPAELIAKKQIAQAQALCYLDKTADSQKLLDEAQALITPGQKQLQAMMNYVRGDCASSGGPADRARASQYFQNAAQLFHPEDGYDEARALGFLGYLLSQDGRYDQAIETFTRAIPLTNSPLVRQMLLGNIGYCYQQLGDWKTAPTYLQQAQEMASGVKDAKADQAKWLTDLGRGDFVQNEYARAEEAFARGLAVAKNAESEGLIQTSLSNLAAVNLITGNAAKARQYLQRMEERHPTGEPRLYLLLNKAGLASLEGDSAAAEGLLKEVLSSSPSPQLRWRSESDLASIYVKQRKFSPAEQMFRDAISVTEKSFSRVVNDQFRISFFDQEPFYDGYVRFLVGRNRPLDALSIAERGRSRALAEALGIDSVRQQLQLGRIQNALRIRRQIVLAYWESPHESYLWLITPSQMKLFKLPDEMEIVRMIEAYNRQIVEPGDGDDPDLGQKLYKILVAPAEKFIPRGADVIIVPHRRLCKLNFETLVSPRPNPHFWIEDVTIRTMSFLGLLTNSKPENVRYTRDMLLIGAPVEASKDFPVLKHAGEEVSKVAGHFPQSGETVISGSGATPDAYRSSDPGQYRFLHFATHGTASDLNPLDSAIILSPGPQGYKLYAREISKLRIHPELVTISTCYGAGKRQYSGEGLVGLAWAFMRVGAHQVVAALWEVDDESNPQLMDRFYGELTKGKDPATALRDGKLQMLHSGTYLKEPYYWASLQLYSGS